jgi:hypothetical protein
MWKNIAESDRPQYGACPMHAGHIRLQKMHSYYAIITAFPSLQQWLHGHASLLHYT